MILLNTVLFITSFALLYFGADFLVKGSVSVAIKLNVSRIVIGLTIVAFGTSMPEFVISFIAGLKGSSDISVGNIVGSNIANIALVLGLSAVIRPIIVDKKINTRDMPILVVFTLSFSFFSLNGIISRLEGIILMIAFAIYLFAIIRGVMVRKENSNLIEKNKDAVHKIYKTPISIFFILIGLVLLVGGAQLLVYSGSFLARKWGVSEVVIGITAIAIGTSLPELFTSVVAAVKGEGAISIGNIVGSNIFNICLVAGVTSTIQPLMVSQRVYNVDNWIMLGLTVLLYPFLISRRVFSRVEGALFFTIYIFFLINAFLNFF